MLRRTGDFGGFGRLAANGVMLRCVVLAVLAVVQSFLFAVDGEAQQPRGRELAYSPRRESLDVPEPPADAELADVAFVDPDRGWAVGEHGAIWNTRDGGRHWVLQASGVTCRLESVCFLDADNGWVAGGRIHPYTHKTSAVVLRTRDGGQSWVEVPALTLPAIKRLRFFDARNGFALGNASAMYGSGLFLTGDGGRTWIPVAGPRSRGWLAGDMADRRGGALAGSDGALAVMLDGELGPSRTPGLGLRGLRCVRLDARGAGWLAGDGGLVLQTVDGGHAWRMPEGELPDGMTTQFDFAAVAMIGERCWIAGSPGTCVLHSADGGHSWQVQRTGQSLPIRSLCFVDERRGWAVGALGTILATDDGGQTWHRQQAGGARAALLALHAEPSRVAWELLARVAAAEGYLSAVEVLGRRDLEVAPDDEAPYAQRTRQAVAAVGGTSADAAWRFPLRQEGLVMPAEAIVGDWDRANDGGGADRLTEYVVRKIRQWRPDVIVTDPPSPQQHDPLAHLVNQIVLRAVALAADSTAFPEQMTLGRLEPWQVKKVFCTLGEGRGQGTITIASAELAPTLGRSLADVASRGRSFIDHQFTPSPRETNLQLVVNRLPEALGRDDIFSGLLLRPGGEARRAERRGTDTDLDQLRQMAQKQRNVTQLLARATGGDGHDGAVWLGQIDELTKGLDPPRAGEILAQLGWRYRAMGNGDLAAETLEALIERYPNHELADSALAYLINYYASGEMAWRYTRQSVVSGGVQRIGGEGPLATDSAPLPANAAGPSQRNPRSTREPFDVAQASFTTDPIVVPDRQPDRVQFGTTDAVAEQRARALRAIELGTLVERTRPSLFVEPSLGFPLASAQRAAGQGDAAMRFLHALARSDGQAAWSQSARGELWLINPIGAPPKEFAECETVAQRPRLDGKLDDEVWQSAKKISLTSALRDDEAWPAEVMLAYDGEFLYLAARCIKAPGASYSTAKGPRPRDADLAPHDRIELLIDIDRDYSSFYRLSIDHRGWTFDALMGDATWNPRWFVASAAGDEGWTIEAAIPLEELAPQPPQQGHAWAIGVQRIVPDAGFQSWTQPAAVVPRGEGFGLLIFN